MISFLSSDARRTFAHDIYQQVLDATLKEITSALLETDVNIKLVASLRQKVKAKVKASLEATSTDKTKETNRKNLIQKVRRLFVSSNTDP